MLAFVLALAGCYRWEPVALGPLRAGQDELRMARVRLARPAEASGPAAAVELIAHRVDAEGIEGFAPSAARELRWRFGPGDRVSVRRPDPWMSGLAVAGVYAAVLAIGWIAVIEDLPGISGRP
ncbi:MAG: hypothetical protein JNK72_24510 [Myxococcales bacterium]|nr:hypothetical protein [Myxococcales bacterium]